ncbi:hypothetical protein [Natronoflexus pectinivorans]|uniref:Uncharacterized protein n=1 Tax=Natronoflexus pectinivorans TaxID=682526 RepID=A0A4R2GFJ9_9BACT|nr:hypothetical protein [Natronoflexus pectinivorans]TCO06967.1 hypothetical protein EV194_11187 [Natronoflexus pectinivorans]
MLTAIHRGKASQCFNGEELDWKELFSGSEDSLTASIFERLFYLPTDLFWFILRNSCYDNDDLPKDCGSLISKEFWPHWDATKTSNSNYIEPDIFIRFEKFDLIIEAKRYDKNQQDPEQWKNQIDAYKNMHDKKLYYIALGGIRSEKKEKCNNVIIFPCQWNRILRAVKKELSNITKDVDATDAPILLRPIFEDLLLAFNIHEFAVGEWFETMPHLDSYINNQSLVTLSDLPFN